MKNKKTLNCKEAKFTQELSIYNNECINNTFKYSLRRASTTNKFFDLLDEQLSNQLLYNTEEKEAYFLNSDRRLFKLKFEPIDIKNKPDLSKEDEIQKLAIPWNKFYDHKNGSYYHSTYNLCALTHLFVDLLQIEKKKQIKIQCGICIMHLLGYFGNFNQTTNKIEIATCEIVPELDFNLGKHDLVYNGIVLIGESIVEKEDETQRILNMIEELSKPKKKFLGLF
jgi:hypothetical protein